jgi:hypothetical protein
MSKANRRNQMCNYCIAGVHTQCTRPWCSCVVLNGLDVHPAVKEIVARPAERDVCQDMYLLDQRSSLLVVEALDQGSVLRNRLRELNQQYNASKNGGRDSSKPTSSMTIRTMTACK